MTNGHHGIAQLRHESPYAVRPVGVNRALWFAADQRRDNALTAWPRCDELPRTLEGHLDHVPDREALPGLLTTVTSSASKPDAS